ncbi:hypothetical protein BKH12_00385 [Actinomyces naeslundii]|nr:hypothetical protein BKH12_00385 [Actinomyces naeslundii]
MSMALTSTPHRRREPGRSLGIPTIPAGHFDGGTPDVSAVDTGPPTCSTPRGLGGGAGCPHQRPASPSPVYPLPGSWPRSR